MIVPCSAETIRSFLILCIAPLSIAIYCFIAIWCKLWSPHFWQVKYWYIACQLLHYYLCKFWRRVEWAAVAPSEKVYSFQLLHISTTHQTLTKLGNCFYYETRDIMGQQPLVLTGQWINYTEQFRHSKDLYFRKWHSTVCGSGHMRCWATPHNCTEHGWLLLSNRIKVCVSSWDLHKSGLHSRNKPMMVWGKYRLPIHSLCNFPLAGRSRLKSILFLAEVGCKLHG